MRWVEDVETVVREVRVHVLGGVLMEPLQVMSLLQVFVLLLHAVGFLPPFFEGSVTIFAPNKALK